MPLNWLICDGWNIIFKISFVKSEKLTMIDRDVSGKRNKIDSSCQSSTVGADFYTNVKLFLNTDGTDGISVSSVTFGLS